MMNMLCGSIGHSFPAKWKHFSKNVGSQLSINKALYPIRILMFMKNAVKTSNYARFHVLAAL
jgi:hypothetical protein